MMNKKILVVCRNFWPEDVKVTRLCSQLSSLGFKIDVLCGQPSGRDGEFVSGYSSVKVRRESHDRMELYRTVDVKRGENSNIRLFLYYISFPLFGSFLIKKLLNKKYEAVLVFQMSPVMMAGPGIRLARKKGIPVYIYTADLWPESLFDVMEVRSGIFRKILYAVSDYYYKKASALIVPTDKMKKYLTERLFLAGKDIFINPLFPDERFGLEKNDDSLREKMAGSFSLLALYGKGEKADVKSVITAAENIRSRGVRNIRFIITGDTRITDEFRRLVRQKDLYEYFFFEEKADEENIAYYINVADVMMHVIIPSEAGEYAVSDMLLNILSTGKPVIATDQGEGKNLIRQARCGLSATAMDGENLFGCIMKVYTMSDEERLEMSRNGWKYNHEYFDPETNAAAIAGILNGEKPEQQEQDSNIKMLWGN